VVQGNVLRFLPSFLLERQHVDIAVALIGRLLEAAGTGAPGASAASSSFVLRDAGAATERKLQSLEPAAV
jgi:hypothetical protein